MIRYLALILVLISACKLIAAPPLFVVTNAMGVEEQGTISSWSLGAKPVFLPVMETKASPIDFLYFKLQSFDMPRIPVENLVWLENGDCLKFEKIRVVDDLVQLWCGNIRGETSEQVTLPILELRMVWWRSPRSELNPLQIRQQFLQKRIAKDQLVLANGEKIEGIFETLEQEKLNFEANETKSTLKTEQLAFMVLGNEKPLVAKPMADTYRVTTTAGDRVTLSKLQLKDSMLVGEMSSGNRVRITIEKVAKMVNISSAAISLSKHDSISLEKTRWLLGAKTVAVPRLSPGVEFFTGAGVVDDGLLLDGNCALKIGRAGKYKALLMTFGADSVPPSAVGASLTFTSGGKAIHKPLEIDAVRSKTLLLKIAGLQEIFITQQTVPGGRVVISDAFLIP